ncbi:MAG: hypothetical protein KAJ91_04385 [Candidatus Aenigmarchaeota archaeon]|nr:hypothetical protein [Candidatus Aenigmarchaeota archaeon]MCK5333838.1 hypothetical protein [Candidatus Aenigmarchaeota archaeon]
MYSKKDRRIGILRGWTDQHDDPLAEILLTYVENPKNFPSLEKYWPKPEQIFDNTEHSRKTLSRLLFGAKFNVSEETLQTVLSRLNTQAKKLDIIEDYRQATEIYDSFHTTIRQPRIFSG